MLYDLSISIHWRSAYCGVYLYHYIQCVTTQYSLSNCYRYLMYLPITIIYVSLFT